MKAAFLGIGQMGKGMSANILTKGFDLIVWNRKGASLPNAEEVAKMGAKQAKTICQAVRDADYIGLALTSDTAVKEIVSEAFEFLKTGAVIADHSTTAPGTAKEMALKLEQKGVYFLDAPVSGGVQGAAAGTLTVMVGGEKCAFDKALPVLKTMGTTVVYMGGSGTGQTTKLINQMLTGVNQAIVCEAMLMGQRAGLDMNTLYNTLMTAWGYSKMLERSVPQYIIPKNYESAACLELMLKDFNCCLEMAGDLGYNVPITELTRHFYQTAKEEGMGKMDHSYIIEVMRKENKLKAE